MHRRLLAPAMLVFWSIFEWDDGVLSYKLHDKLCRCSHRRRKLQRNKILEFYSYNPLIHISFLLVKQISFLFYFSVFLQTWSPRAALSQTTSCLWPRLEVGGGRRWRRHLTTTSICMNPFPPSLFTFPASSCPFISPLQTPGSLPSSLSLSPQFNPRLSGGALGQAAGAPWTPLEKAAHSNQEGKEGGGGGVEGLFQTTWLLRQKNPPADNSTLRGEGGLDGTMSGLTLFLSFLELSLKADVALRSMKILDKKMC